MSRQIFHKNYLSVIFRNTAADPYFEKLYMKHPYFACFETSAQLIKKNFT